MNAKGPSGAKSDRPDNPLGDLIRQWRGRRGRSQLQLSLDMGVSQRHISFIESGRSLPSRALLLGLARALDTPLRDRNSLLLAAGFAPMYSDQPWNATEMQVVNRALTRMLRQHAPFPAIVMDRYWNVLMTNDYAPAFFGSFVDLSHFPKPRNLLRLMFDPNGMRPFVENWDQVAKGLFERISRESTGGVVDETTKNLIADLLAFPGVSMDWSTSEKPGAIPVVPVSFVKDGRRLNYFSMISTVGTPQTIAAQEMRVESMFPADDATEEWHLSTFEQAPAG